MGPMMEGILFPGPDKRPGNMTFKIRLYFFNSNCAGLTNFNATFTSQTLIGVHRDGFVVHHFENFNGADIHTFFTTFTLVLINSRDKSHFKSLLSN